MKLPPPKWLQASINYEQGLEQSGYYRKRTTREMGGITFWIWLIVIVAVMALITTSHHDEEMTNGVNRQEIMKWTSEEPAGTWAQRELWILREAKNSSAVMDSFHVMAGRE